MISALYLIVSKICIRNILGIRWPDSIGTVNLWRRIKQKPVDVIIRTRRWKWILHTLRKANSNITKQAVEWNPQGQRKPKNTWRRGLSSDLRKIGKTWGEAKAMAQDRRRWKATVVALCPPPPPLGRSGLSQVSQGNAIYTVYIFVNCYRAFCSIKATGPKICQKRVCNFIPHSSLLLRKKLDHTS